jgi:hypothetical protein
MKVEQTERATAGASSVAAGDTDAPAPKRDMSPEAAVARHVEWLEHALTVAREEETRRQEKLGRAKDKNREKRTARLAEVVDEVAELEALVAGITALRPRAGAGTKS